MTIAEELSKYAYAVKYSDIPENVIHESKKESLMPRVRNRSFLAFMPSF